MPEPDPTPTEWRQLYAAAAQIMRIAPWQWMMEDQLFGVQNPDTGEIGFVSVMGHLGEHLAVAVYRGPRALYDFLVLHDNPAMAPTSVIEMEQLQVAFGDRDQLTDRDRRLIKELGLKFRGRQAWPYFRSHRHGHWPWYLEAAEVRFLAQALEQAALVIPRMYNDPVLLDSTELDTYLVRVLSRNGDHVSWGDQRMTIPAEPPPPVTFLMSSELLARVKRLPRKRATLEIDYFVLPVPIGSGHERPLLAKMVLLVDHDTGMVIGSEFLQREPGVDDPLALILVAVARLLERSRSRPTRILANSPLVAQFVEILGEELGYTVEVVPYLAQLEAAREFLFDHMM